MKLCVRLFNCKSLRSLAVGLPLAVALGLMLGGVAGREMEG